MDSLRDQRDETIQRLSMAHFKLAEAARFLGQWQIEPALKMARWCGGGYGQVVVGGILTINRLFEL